MESYSDSTNNTNQSVGLLHYIVLMLLLWSLLGYLYYYLCCVPSKTAEIEKNFQAAKTASIEQNSQKDKTSVTQTNDPKTNHETINLKPVYALATPFAVAIGGGTSDIPVFLESESFNFPENDFVHTLPMSTELNQNLIKLRDFMIDNPSKRLNILGKYKSSERNRTMFPNLGIARANDIKNHLVGMGFISKQIDVGSEKFDDAKSDNGILYSMANFSVLELSQEALIEEKNKVALIKEKITTEPLILTFDVGQAEIGMSDKQRTKILNIVEYVGKTKGSVVTVTGHTDSLGTDENNYELGKDRANFASKFLTDNGLPSSVIKVFSKGETQPIASNATEQGRMKNRRTVITVE